MPVLIRSLLTVLCFFTLLRCSDPAPASAPESTNAKTLFTLLPASETGVTFENRLREGPNTNILMYEYFYNGGGVAAGDLNGDGKTDLYFTANMAENELYLNEGDLNFREVTQASGAGGRPGPWKTGVTLADVNADGKLDIYLCYSGALPAAKRANQLFINLGNNPEGVPQFRDEAAAYGLAGTAFSNQLYFFDYDLDGDLDGLLLNHNPKSLPILNPAKTKQLLREPDPERGLRLYRNDGGKFVDVTEDAGINGSALSYGLGLSISDLDNDGDPDFYVSNDYEVPDYLYYNNGDGTFTDRLGEQIGHISHFSMGSDIGDIDNNGLQDIFTLDMLPADNRRNKLLMADDNRSKLDLNLASGFHHQTMRNMLQLNRGDGSFAEIGRLAGVSMTDWSWSALLADFDNDGWQDLHVTNGYLKDYTNMDFIKYMESYVAQKGRLQRADLRGLLEKMPASDVNNYAFANRKNSTFEDKTKAWGLERPSNSNGAVYVDLDNDGDLDLVISNLDQQAFIYRNNSEEQHYLSVTLEGSGGNTGGIGARVEITVDGKTLVREFFPNRGYLSSVDPVLHFGLGDGARVQALVVRWPDGRVQRLEDLDVDQRIVLRQSEARNRMEEEMAPAPIFVAVNPPLNHRDKLTGKRDFDGEPLLLRQYSDAGPQLTDEGTVSNKNPWPLAVSSGSPLTVFSGNNYLPGKYPLVDKVGVTVDGKELSDLPESLKNAPKINAAAWADLNGDGNEELMVAGEWMPVMIYAYTDKTLTEVTEKYLPKKSNGWYTALHLTDLNGDGQPDIIVGNQGLNNTFTASPERPVELHTADLDNNGSIDPILSYYDPADGKRYPDATRDELLGQLTALRKRYPNYESYASQTLDEVFPTWPEGTIHLSADWLETTLYLSQPDGSYAIAPLPMEVQYAPVHTITELDYNNDGHTDLLLCGNDRMEKQRWGRSDANAGMLLRGDGSGGFSYVPQSESGFQLRGDVRSVVKMGDLLLFGIRGEKVRAYRQQRTEF